MTHSRPHASGARRLVPRSAKDKLEAEVIGQSYNHFGDMYARLLDASWWCIGVFIVLAYCLTNLVFACLYLATGNGIENARPGSFTDAFFFSVQTMATIGYGKMGPSGIMANALVTVEALAGFCFLAVMTGLIFARFSRPTARILFSEIAVITPYNGIPHLMMRLANQRGNRIVDARVHMTMLRKEISSEGHRMRRFHDIAPVRERMPILQLTWTIMHPIDENSPLFGMTPEKLQEDEVEIVVSVNGLDETLSQTVHARYSYIADEILCGAVFEDVLNRAEDGRLQVNYQLFHATRK